MNYIIIIFSKKKNIWLETVLFSFSYIILKNYWLTLSLKAFIWRKNLGSRNTQRAQLSTSVYLSIYLSIYLYIHIYIIYICICTIYTYMYGVKGYIEKFLIINFTSITLPPGSDIRSRSSVYITYVMYPSTWVAFVLVTRKAHCFVFMITYLLWPSCFCEIWALCVSWITYGRLWLHMVFTFFVNSRKIFFEQTKI